MVFCRLYLPENNTSRHVVIALAENIKIVDRDGNLLEKPFCHDIEKQWRRLTERRLCYCQIVYLTSLCFIVAEIFGWGLFCRLIYQRYFSKLI
ncbi:hypothetical protein DPMN_103026 [Dreissena polymorpha]|uniref:Uncharacterized protein n=1 Tax=Dreissena polymorpha TaxID=45954 RepID=A0A9D4H7P9_DREPO|nr:hypothetical protein DPMN_103026 [Dreissena polymorpha]